ncbi:MAG: DedA family protein [Candidatus Yanofskybacteria bacterium]|nr:DedA family protein [Candidatus Yanofskybacteria bacterium]
MNFLIGTIGAKSLELLERWGYGGAFLLSILDRVSISLIPSEVLLPLYGFLSGRGVFPIWLIYIVINIGSLIGESILYLIFAKGGRPFLEKYGRYFLVYKHDLDHLDRLFVKYGTKLVFWGRFLPFARSIIAIPAGISRLNFKNFAVYSFLGMLPYNFFLLLLGEKTGENFAVIKPYLDIAEKAAMLILAALVIWYIYRHLKKRHLTHE